MRDKRSAAPNIVDILLFRAMITMPMAAQATAAALVCKWLMDFCLLRACEYYLSYYCTQTLRLFVVYESVISAIDSTIHETNRYDSRFGHKRTK